MTPDETDALKVQAAKWSQKTWAAYVEQVRENVPLPDISPRVCLRPMPYSARYVCPFCLCDSGVLRVVASEGGGTFTARWQECGHSVEVGGGSRGSAASDAPPRG